MQKQFRNGLRVFASALLVFMLLFLSGAVSLNLTPLKSPISRLLEKSTGLEVAVSGELHLRLGLHPRLRVTGLEVMAEDGSGYFARLAELALQLQLGELLGGELAFDELTFGGLRIDTCVPLPNLAQNPDSEPAAFPALSLDSFDGGNIEIGCSGSLEYKPLHIGRISGTAVKAEAISLVADLQWRGRAFRLDLEGDSLDALLHQEQPYAVAISAVTGASRLAVDAVIEDLVKAPKLRAEVNARLDQPDNLLALFDIQPTGLPEISLQGRLGQAGKLLSIEALSGRFGKSSWSLSGLLDWSKQRPLLTLDGQWDQLDIDALRSARKLLPPSGSPALTAFDRELPLELLDLVDARIDLRVHDLTALQAPPADLALHMELESGRPRFEVTEFQSRLGRGNGRITLERGPDCPVWGLSARLAVLDLDAISALAGLDAPTLGTLEKGEATLQACGRTLRAIRDSLELSATIHGLQLQPPADLAMVGIEAATLRAGWGQPAVLEASLVLDQQPLDGRVEAGKLALLQEGLDWPVQLALVSTDAELAVKGLVRRAAEQVSAMADVTFDASRSGPMLSLLGFEAGRRGKFALNLHAAMDGEHIAVNDLKLTLGRSQLEGSLLLQRVDSQLESELMLRSHFVDISELGQMFAAWEDPTSPRDATPGDELPGDELPGDELPGSELPGSALSGIELLNIDWPLLRLDLAFDDIHGYERDITDLRLTGFLRDQRIDKARLALAVSGLSFLAQLDADLSARVPWASIEMHMRNVDLGGMLATLDLTDSAEVRARQLWLRFASSGTNLHKMAHNLKLDFELLQLDPILLDDLPLTITEVVGTARPNIPVSLSFTGEFDEFPVNGWLQLAPVSQLLDPRAPLPVRAVFGTNRETLMLDGIFQPADGTGLQASLQLSAMERVVARQDMEQLAAPLPGLVVDAAIDLAQESAQTIELALALGNSRIESSIVGRLEGARKRLQVAVNSPHLQTTDFSALVALFREEHSTVQPKAASETAQKGFLELLDDYLRRVPESYDLDIQANFNELLAGELFLGSAKLLTSISQQNIARGVLELASPEGEVSINYSMDHTAAGVHSKLDARIEHFELGGLFRTLDPKGSAEGALYVDTSLEAIAPGKEEIAGAVSGHLDLAVFPRNMSADVLDLWATNLIFALMPRGDDGHKEMNCLVARFEIEDGIMQSNNILLDSTDVIVHGKGSINLAKGELDLVFAPQAKRERFLSVSSPISISGPFEEFDVGMAGAGWLGTVFRWYLSLIYVPWKWLTGERFPADGIETCLRYMDWQVVGDEPTGSGATH